MGSSGGSVFSSKWPCYGVGVCLAVTLASLDPNSLIAEESKAAVRARTFRATAAPMLKKYCWECHGKGTTEGDVNLEQYSSLEKIESAKPEWRKVLAKLRSEEMPPKDAAKPTREERDALVAWLDDLLNAVDCIKEADPGRVTLRRLNRFEYRNTIRDLLLVDYEPATDFPGDDVGYGFDNIGDVLSLPTLLMEKYLAAADVVTRKAIITTGLDAVVLPMTLAADLKGSDGSPYRNGGRILASSGEVWVEVNLPTAGEYEMRVVAFGQQAGPEPTKMELRLDGKAVETIEVKAVESKPETYTRKGKATPGKHKVSIAFVNDYYKPDDPDPKNRDRNFVVESVMIIGPLGVPRTDLPESHRKVFFVPADGKAKPAEIAKKVLQRFASRAFRRPATDGEVARLVKLYELGREQGDNFEESVRLAMQAVLVSPHFLFRIEADPGATDPGGIRTLTDIELATRLSYFLWSTMPDDELFALAWQNKLRKDGNLAKQVHRMVLDPKAKAFVQNFAFQWLQLRKLDEFQPDTKRFPAFNDKLREAMKTETEMVFAHVMRENRSVIELLNGDYSFVNEPLAHHYGISGVVGEAFQQVSLKGQPRVGVLTHASVLAATSNPTRTSPVKRGKWILENIIGEPPPPPVPNAPNLMEGEQAELKGSLRQRMEQHRVNPNCASCHQRMDALGFALENFDAVGGWRVKDGEFPVDSVGELPSGEKFSGPQELVNLLIRTKQDQFVRCLTEKTLTYGLGRGLELYDRCAVDKITEQLSKNGYRFETLILGIVESDPFQKRSIKKSEP